MSYVGEPFDYDVFVSYAHAENETGAAMLRDWSKLVAGSLRDRLATALNPTVEPGSAVQVFLDDRVLRSGDPLTETLREKVQRSALLLVLMSPLYPKKSWCLDELDWFFTQADRDGRGQRHCSVLHIQPLPDTVWPKRLRDERDKPVVFREFADPDEGLPLGFDDPNAPALKAAIRETHIELLGKLKELRGQLAARRVYQQAAVPPVHPVLYLQARREDLPHWQATRVELDPRAIVNPESCRSRSGTMPCSSSSATSGWRSMRNVTASSSSAPVRTTPSASRSWPLTRTASAFISSAAATSLGPLSTASATHLRFSLPTACRAFPPWGQTGPTS